jgi:hypothetical protein
MNKLIKNEIEWQLLCEDIRNRQYESNPVMVDLSNIFEHLEPYNWGLEFLKITNIDNVDVVELIKY